jgi:hypothetical protein
MVRDHPLSLSEAHRRRFLTGSWDQLLKLRRDLEKRKRVSAQPPSKETELLNLVKSVERHKLIAESLSKGVTALETPQRVISVYSLLRVMFYTVASAMDTTWQPWGKNTVGRKPGQIAISGHTHQ